MPRSQKSAMARVFLFFVGHMRHHLSSWQWHHVFCFGDLMSHVNPWPPDWNGSRSGCRERPSWQRARKLLRWDFWTFESDMENVSILDLTPTTSHNHKNIYFRREGLGFALCICKNEAKSPVAKSCHSSHDHQAVVIDSSLNRLTGHVEPLFDVEMQRSLSLGDILLFLIEAAEATHLRKKTTGFPTCDSSNYTNYMYICNRCNMCVYHII